MSRVYVCDHCEGHMDDPTFEVMELTDEVDEDGDAVYGEWHLCTVQCLSTWAMSRALDSPKAGR